MGCAWKFPCIISCGRISDSCHTPELEAAIPAVIVLTANCLLLPSFCPVTTCKAITEFSKWRHSHIFTKCGYIFPCPGSTVGIAFLSLLIEGIGGSCTQQHCRSQPGWVCSLGEHPWSLNSHHGSRWRQLSAFLTPSLWGLWLKHKNNQAVLSPDMRATTHRALSAGLCTPEKSAQHFSLLV